MSGSQSFEDVYNVQTKRIADLEAENARLRELIDQAEDIILDHSLGYDVWLDRAREALENVSKNSERK